MTTLRAEGAATSPPGKYKAAASFGALPMSTRRYEGGHDRGLNGGRACWRPGARAGGPGAG
eukprot:4265215-Pyramimonas_sp.AAC.1